MRREQVCAPGRRRADRSRGWCASRLRGSPGAPERHGLVPWGARNDAAYARRGSPAQAELRHVLHRLPLGSAPERGVGRFLRGVLAGAFLAAIGVLGRDVVFAATSIVFGAAFVVGAAVDAGWSRGLVSVDMVPVGCVTVRPSARLTVLRIVTVVCAILALVLYGFSFLFGTTAVLVRFGCVASCALVTVTGMVGRFLFSHPQQERIVLAQDAVTLRGKDGVSYTIPWSDKPAVIGQRQRRTLLIRVGEDVECPISFAHPRILPSRVKSLLAFYHRNPEARGRLDSSSALDDALKGLCWYRTRRR